MPRLSSWKSDTFCLGTLRAGASKTLRASIIPAKEGAHEMSITLGKAKVYRELRRALIVDDDALYWEEDFVIVG